METATGRSYKAEIMTSKKERCGMLEQVLEQMDAQVLEQVFDQVVEQVWMQMGEQIIMLRLHAC